MYDYTSGILTPHPNAQDQPGERRLSRRYPLQLSLSYAAFLNGVLAATGQGHTCDISTGGVLLYPNILPLHAFVLLTISWPVPAASARLVTLLAAGYAVRTGPLGTAVQITSYEFIFEHRYVVRRPPHR